MLVRQQRNERRKDQKYAQELRKHPMSCERSRFYEKVEDRPERGRKRRETPEQKRENELRQELSSDRMR